MTDTVLEQLLERLIRKLGLEEPDGDALALLEDELRDAEGELALYLGWSPGEVSGILPGQTVELAALHYRLDQASEDGLESWSYSEGQVSESGQRRTPERIGAAMAELKAGLARHRRVKC